MDCLFYRENPNASTIEDLLPGSAALPQKVIIPEPKETKPEKYAWEED
jgi:hypothetical protein